jgi:hypothetical protein
MRWADEEGSECLAGHRLRVFGVEILGLVLTVVREGDATASNGFNALKLLQIISLITTDRKGLSNSVDGSERVVVDLPIDPMGDIIQVTAPRGCLY